MACRLGLLPRQEARLMPTEIRDLYDGLLWRHSRMIEIVAMQTTQIRGMMAETHFLDVLRAFPLYDGALFPEER